VSLKKEIEALIWYLPATPLSRHKREKHPEKLSQRLGCIPAGFLVPEFEQEIHYKNLRLTPLGIVE
jgi:hypothetical protein